MANFSLIPKEKKFYDLFEEDSKNAVEAARVLLDLVNNWENVELKINHITDLEHQGDEITHKIVSNLHTTFITPIDREDIASLAHTIDDVVDFIQAAADAMLIYRVSSPTQRCRELAAIILQATEELVKAMPDLRNPGQLQHILVHCVEMNRLENAADRVYRAALGELFVDTKNVAEILKWREIYNHMESATDRCEDVANVLEGVALKYA